MRDPQTLIRYFAPAGKEGYEHRNIGLERDAQKGSISTGPLNHELMTLNRAKKVAGVANRIPLLTVCTPKEALQQPDTLLVGFGSTEGHLKAAADELTRQGIPTALAHFNYINPLPLNTEQVLREYKRIIVCELNNGQFATLLRGKIEGLHLEQFNRLEAQPFQVSEIVEYVKGTLKK